MHQAVCTAGGVEARRADLRDLLPLYAQGVRLHDGVWAALPRTGWQGGGEQAGEEDTGRKRGATGGCRICPCFLSRGRAGTAAGDGTTLRHGRGRDLADARHTASAIPIFPLCGTSRPDSPQAARAASP